MLATTPFRIANTSIRDMLRGLLGKPIEKPSALVISDYAVTKLTAADEARIAAPLKMAVKGRRP